VFSAKNAAGGSLPIEALVLRQIYNSTHVSLHANLHIGEYVYNLDISSDGTKMVAVCHDNTLKVGAHKVYNCDVMDTQICGLDVH
jgi:hypothetical protein